MSLVSVGSGPRGECPTVLFLMDTGPSGECPSIIFLVGSGPSGKCATVCYCHHQILVGMCRGKVKN